MTTRQQLSRQRVGLASRDDSHTHDSNAGRGQASTRQHDCASARAARPERLRGLQQPLHQWRTGASVVTSYTAAAPVEDWRRRAAAPVEDRSRRTSREPAARVMDWWRSCQSSDSDSESRSLRTAGLGQPAGQHHLPAPTGVRRGTSDCHGWIGSNVGSRAGRAATMMLREF